MVNRNVRERPAAIFSIAKGDGSLLLPSVNLETVSKQRRPRKGNQFSSSICIWLGTIVSIIYVVYHFSSSAEETPSVEQSPLLDPQAFHPDWSMRLEAIRPYLIRTVPEEASHVKETAVEECADAESVCEEVKSDSQSQELANKAAEMSNRVSEESKEQIRAKLACGVVMHSCEQVVEKLKSFINDSSVSNPLKYVSKCSSKCLEKGSCNEELQRCDCLSGFTGKNCEKSSLSACQISTNVSLPCFDEAIPCSCLLGCEKAKILNVDLIKSVRKSRYSCFDDSNATISKGKETNSKTKEEFFSFPLVSLQTNGKGGQISQRLPEDLEAFEGNLAISRKSCPGECSGKGACISENCLCPLTRGGISCEISLFGPQSGCLNSCSGRGNCVDGVCHCERDFFGVDCSIFPTGNGKFGVLKRNPYPAAFSISEHVRKKVEEKKLPTESRPRIYVYELPSHMLAWLFQHRKNPKEKEDSIKFLEPLIFYEALLASDYRTGNADEADYFFVPIFLYLHGPSNERFADAIDYISTHWPYWTRHRGADHIFYVSEEWGTCNLDPLGWREKHLRNSIVLTPWTYRRNMFGGSLYPCFIAGQDIGVPLLYDHSVIRSSPFVLNPKAPFAPKRILVAYHQIGAYNHMFRPRRGWVGLEEAYRETGLRKYKSGFGLPKLIQTYFAKMEDPQIKVTFGGSEDPFSHMRDALFCLSPPGWGVDSEWSTLSVLFGCIPVFFKTNESYAFGGEGIFDWDEISVSLDEKDLPNLKYILDSLPAEVVEAKRKAMKRLWYRFVWASPNWNPLENLHTGDFELHAPNVARFGAFETVMTILRNRLGNKVVKNEEETLAEEALNMIAKDSNDEDIMETEDGLKVLNVSNLDSEEKKILDDVQRSLQP